MSRSRLQVILSQAQGRHPAKRALEESLVAALLVEPGIEIAVVPYLYDLDADHTGRLFLESVKGDFVLLSWLYPRAAFWLLDRDGIKGKEGQVELLPPESDDDEEVQPPKGIGALDVPDRYIYCVDLRNGPTVDVFLEEIRRIMEEAKARQSAKQPTTTFVELGLPKPILPIPMFSTEQLLAIPDRRWYPVIDYSRCTNCLECLDFCLFGVYGVDSLDRIVVETQDNCKKGCPACSRVCPEHAIMFPDYKTAAIAGAPVGGIASLKIDLTKLFGGGDALKTAAQERDRELVNDGRVAVGMSVGIPKRQTGKPIECKDELDGLLDQLDAIEL